MTGWTLSVDSAHAFVTRSRREDTERGWIENEQNIPRLITDVRRRLLPSAYPLVFGVQRLLEILDERAADLANLVEMINGLRVQPIWFVVTVTPTFLLFKT